MSVRSNVVLLKNVRKAVEAAMLLLLSASVTYKVGRLSLTAGSHSFFFVLMLLPWNLEAYSSSSRLYNASRRYNAPIAQHR